MLEFYWQEIAEEIFFFHFSFWYLTFTSHKLRHYLLDYGNFNQHFAHKKLLSLALLLNSCSNQLPWNHESVSLNWFSVATKLTELLLTQLPALYCLLYGTASSLMSVLEGFMFMASSSLDLYKCRHRCFNIVVCIFCLHIFLWYCWYIFVYLLIFFLLLKIFIIVLYIYSCNVVVFLFTSLPFFMLVFVVTLSSTIICKQVCLHALFWFL